MTKHVLTLIANPDKSKLSGKDIAAVKSALTIKGALILAEEWLAEEIACDIFFTHLSPEEADKAARAALASPIDLIAQPTESRQKRLLVTDMDSTIITCECIDEIADFAGIKDQVAAITLRAMNGELDFKTALVERVRLLKDSRESVLERVYNQRVRLMPGAIELVRTMRNNGARCVLVSGGFTYFTSRVRADCGFNRDISNQLEIKDGVLTGEVLPPILDKTAKLQILLEETAARGLSTDDVLAAGDGANDLPMILAAGLGVAYHAKPIVTASARHRIDHCDLTALLYAQGYKQDEFAA